MERTILSRSDYVIRLVVFISVAFFSIMLCVYLNLIKAHIIRDLDLGVGGLEEIVDYGCSKNGDSVLDTNPLDDLFAQTYLVNSLNVLLADLGGRDAGKE